MMERQITGKHVAFGFVAAFGVIIGVNILLAISAVRTFPGLEVGNSYVASQNFDARRTAQEALGWQVGARHSDGVLTLSITDEAGQPVRATEISATLGRATHVADDTQPAFQFDGTAYVVPVELGAGNWNIRLAAVSEDGTEFQQRVILIKE